MVKPLISYTDPDVDIHPPEESLLIPDRIKSEFERGVIIRAEKIPEDLPPQFRGWMIEEHNTKSLVIVPLTAGNQIMGNLTFASYRKERKWSDGHTPLVRTLYCVLRLYCKNSIFTAKAQRTQRKEYCEVSYTGKDFA